ncbi:hypothetical protein HLB44_34980 [Aquincola sp. S2]|uniref:Uncharacterized protein n=1 Tax=Pseudaquabacterium terrae TaxID=2732868 RepID=A0ABX2EUP8_9BURK|nr:hypothetical protein [Aquabacterium terrae]NRF72202.1 hypothetical protein [Aquabacterium terrae]
MVKGINGPKHLAHTAEKNIIDDPTKTNEVIRQRKALGFTAADGLPARIAHKAANFMGTRTTQDKVRETIEFLANPTRGTANVQKLTNGWEQTAVIDKHKRGVLDLQTTDKNEIIDVRRSTGDLPLPPQKAKTVVYGHRGSLAAFITRPKDTVQRLVNHMEPRKTTEARTGLPTLVISSAPKVQLRSQADVSAAVEKVPVIDDPHVLAQVIQDRLSNFIRTRTLADPKKRVVVFVAEMHYLHTSKVALLAALKAVSDAFPPSPGKEPSKFLIEWSEEELKGTRGGASIEGQVEELAKMMKNPEFAEEVTELLKPEVEIGEDVRRLAKSVFAKELGFELGAFDPLHGKDPNMTEREAAMTSSLRKTVKGSQTPIIVSAGAFHLAPLHRALEKEAHVVCVAHVVAPEEDVTAEWRLPSYLKRRSHTLMHPDVLQFRTSMAIEKNLDLFAHAKEMGVWKHPADDDAGEGPSVKTSPHKGIVDVQAAIAAPVQAPIKKEGKGKAAEGIHGAKQNVPSVDQAPSVIEPTHADMKDLAAYVGLPVDQVIATVVKPENIARPCIVNPACEVYRAKVNGKDVSVSAMVDELENARWVVPTKALDNLIASLPKRSDGTLVEEEMTKLLKDGFYIQFEEGERTFTPGGATKLINIEPSDDVYEMMHKLIHAMERARRGDPPKQPDDYSPRDSADYLKMRRQEAGFAELSALKTLGSLEPQDPRYKALLNKNEEHYGSAWNGVLTTYRNFENGKVTEADAATALGNAMVDNADQTVAWNVHFKENHPTWDEVTTQDIESLPGVEPDDVAAKSYQTEVGVDGKTIPVYVKNEQMEESWGNIEKKLVDVGRCEDDDEAAGFTEKVFDQFFQRTPLRIPPNIDDTVSVKLDPIEFEGKTYENIAISYQLKNGELTTMRMLDE